MNIFFWQKKWYKQPKWLIVFTIVLVAIIFGGLFFYTHFFLYRDTLIKKVPADVQLYAHFYLPGYPNIWPFNKIEQGLPEQTKNVYKWADKLLTNDNFSFTQDILPFSREVALIAYTNQDNSELFWAWMVKIKNREAIDFKLKLNPEINHQFINPHFLIISNLSAGINEFVSQLSQVEIFLADDLVVKQNFQQFSSYSSGKFYCNIATWPTELNGDNFFSNLFVGFLKNQKVRKIFAAGRHSADGVIGQLVTQPTLLPDKLSTANYQSSIQEIPPQTVSLLQGVNWATMFEYFSRATPEASSLFNNWQQIYEQLYQFDWGQEILPLIDGDSDLLLIKNGDRLSQDWWPKNKFILIIKPRQDLTPGNYQRLEKIIQEMLARYSPGERQRVLPDKTTITELVADPEHWQFTGAEIIGRQIRFIKDDELKLEFIYSPATDNQPLILSNSLSQLTSFWNQQDNQQNNRSKIKNNLLITDSPTRNFLDLTELGFSQNLFGFTKVVIQSEGSGVRFKLY